MKAEGVGEAEVHYEIMPNSRMRPYSSLRICPVSDEK